MAEHSTLTGANLHEPKGVASATASQVYVSDGAGSGTWTDTQDIKISYVVTAVIADVSAAETVYIPTPIAGTVVNVMTVLEGAIATSDDTLTVSNSAAASMGTITIANAGSAAGDVDTLVPASNNTVSANDYITISTDGASTSAQRCWVAVTIERS